MVEEMQAFERLHSDNVAHGPLISRPHVRPARGKRWKNVEALPPITRTLARQTRSLQDLSADEKGGRIAVEGAGGPRPTSLLQTMHKLRHMGF